MPAEDGVGGDDGGDGFQGFAAQHFAFDGQAAPLVIGQEDAFLAEFLLEDFDLGAEELDGGLLLVIDPAGEEGDQELPGLQDEVHGGASLREETGYHRLAKRACQSVRRVFGAAFGFNLAELARLSFPICGRHNSENRCHLHVG